MLYLDSSALLKVYIEEPGALAVREAARRARSTASSLLTYAELRAALSRLVREQELTKRDQAATVARLDKDWLNVAVVPVAEATVRLAGSLADRHALSGSDAIQLASASEIRTDLSRKSPLFATWDRRLWQAARAEGFDVLPESAP